MHRGWWAHPAIVVVAIAAAAAGAGRGVAHAGGPDEPFAPRSVGRAGVGTVSDDGLGAVFASPAALARRATTRAQVGTAIVDDGVTFTPDRANATAARDQGGPTLAPAIAIIAGVGPLVVGAAAAVDATGRSFATPDAGLSAASVDRFFAYRYAGLAAEVQRRSAGVAVAVRVTDWLAIGATATLASVRIRERRRLWAGFSGRGDVPGDPRFDVDVRLAGDDTAVPGGVFGAFVAPAAVPLELAGSVAWANHIHATGTAALAPASAELAAAGGGARLDLPTAVVARGGARWLAERWTAEANVEAWVPRGTAEMRWQLTGASVTDVLTQRAAAVVALPSRFALRRRVSARAAVDVEVVTGLVWLTAGYAWHGAGTPDGRFAPTTAALGGHTAALGVEIAAAGVTASFGWSRSFTAARTIRASALGLDDPFDPIAVPTGLGRYDATRDVVGVSLEVARD